jgi:glycosyltransferase involved in cell wall biosynthesis
VKILFFIDSTSAGGKERRLTELMKNLRALPDIDFELVIMSNDVHYEEIFSLNIKIHYVIRDRKRDISIFRKFYKICRDFKPDIVHSWDSMTATFVLPTCKILGIKFVNGLIVDAPVNNSIFNKYMFRARFSFLFSNLIIGNSRAGLTAYKAPPGKSIVIHNGFDFNRIREVHNSINLREEFLIGTKFIVGMVATFSKFKDYNTYYSAAQSLLKRRKDVTFLAIGNETDLEESINLVDPSFRQYFRFMGKRSNVESLVNEMDICVLSTFTEGISNSILEYMALGKPVIATAGGGTNEIVENNVTGYLIRPSEPDELADKIEILLNDESIRIAFGTAGKRCVHENFSIETMVDKYLNCYKTILSKENNITRLIHHHSS